MHAQSLWRAAGTSQIDAAPLHGMALGQQTTNKTGAIEIPAQQAPGAVLPVAQAHDIDRAHALGGIGQPGAVGEDGFLVGDRDHQTNQIVDQWCRCDESREVFRLDVERHHHRISRALRHQRIERLRRADMPDGIGNDGHHPGIAGDLAFRAAVHADSSLTPAIVRGQSSCR